ncbi:MAG TPA: hypothetical protein VK572_05460 [Burkholderiales bacterium]|nr:hypothetical protein [Burkholderiales bacterium]
MNRRSILTKTGKGLMEATGKTSNLSRESRNILKEIDGKVSVSELQEKFGKMPELKLLEALSSMEREGYLREFVGKQEELLRTPPARAPVSQSPADKGEDLDFTSFTPAKPSAKASEDARLQTQAQEIARQAQATRAREEAAAKARAELAARAKAEAEQRARLAQASADAEQKARLAAQASPKAGGQAAGAQARTQAEALDQARREADERQRREAEEKARREAEARARIEAEQAPKREAEERVRREIQEKERRENEEKARREAGVRAQREAEEKVRRDAEERVRREVEERARKEVEERMRREDAERRRREEEERVRKEAEERERHKREVREQAERKTRIEAEARAQVEAEMRARREAEERVQREEAERGRREEQLRRRTEEEARERREADERQALELSLRVQEEKARREAEEREREEERRRDDEERVRREAEEEAQRAEEEETRAKEDERQARDEEKAQAKTAAQTRKTVRAKERAGEESWRGDDSARDPGEASLSARELWAKRKPGSLAKQFAVLLLVILIVGIAALPFVPLESGPYERSAQAWLGVPVKIGTVNLTLLPMPQLKFEKVVIGKEPQMRAASVKAMPEIASVLEDRMSLKSLELENATVPREFLSVLLQDKGGRRSLGIQRISVKGLKLDIPELNLPELELNASLSSDGALQSVVLSNAERKLTVKLEPKGGRAAIEISADGFPLPLGMDLPFSDFLAKGTVTRNELALSEAEVRAFGGRLLGNARLRWSDGWSLEGDLAVRQMDAAKIAGPLIAGGELGGKGTYSMKALLPERLLLNLRLEGNFTVQKGSITNVDMPRLLQGSSTGGGTTLFSEMSGGVSVDPNRILVRQIRLAAGLLNGTGQVEMDPQKNLSGRMQVELRAQTVQARATLAVGGTLKDPQFRRSN